MSLTKHSAAASHATQYRLDLNWRLVTDAVMGGVSSAKMTWRDIDAEPCVCIRGRVRTETNGGFVQLLTDLPASLSADYAGYIGLSIRLRGNGQTYSIHLKTTELAAPWQSYRQSFAAPIRWTEIRFPFADFKPHRTQLPLNLARLRRLGVVAIGRAFEAELCVSHVSLYGGPQPDDSRE